MMIFTSIYGVVDGFFVSNFVGELQFAALNLIYPFVMILGSVGFMLGTGGNALVSKIFGEGKSERANRVFSMLVYATVAIGAILSLLGIVFAKEAAELFALSEKTLNATDKAKLKAIYDEINQLEKSKVEVTDLTIYHEQYLPLVLLAIALLLVEFLFGQILLKRIP